MKAMIFKILGKMIKNPFFKNDHAGNVRSYIKIIQKSSFLKIVINEL